MIRALLGGSFDPFHNGHLAMVQCVLDRELAHQVLVVPAYHSPHKQPPQASANHRLDMAQLAVGHLPSTRVLDLEVARGGISYTIDTVEELVQRWPHDALHLIIGADTLATFHLWRRPEKLLDLAPPIVLARGDWQGELPALLTGRARVVREFNLAVSATLVRAELVAGRWPRNLVPHAVLDYIAEQDLYTTVVPPLGEAEE